MQLFQDRKLIIATMHRKERVIAPILEKELGVCCFIDDTFDTDAFGTFTKDVERVLDPVATAREKCLRAMKLNNCDLGIASEGSFGPHPTLHFINADDEFLIFIDLKNQIEIIARELNTSTNFNGKQIQNQSALLEFAEQIGFPEHGLILRLKEDDNTAIYKGIIDIETLKKTFDHLYLRYHSVYVETDMRALFNPTRMKVIEKAAQKLVQKIKSTCPKCQMPGFAVTDAKKGLVCKLCGLPTNAILSYIYVCQHCCFKEEKMYPNNELKGDPMYCNYCNP